MWYDPSIKIDLSFLSLIPSLDDHTAIDCPIQNKHLRQLMNKSVEGFHLTAAIGAIRLLFLKNDNPLLIQEFPVVELSLLDRLFYLIGENMMSNKTQNYMLQFTRLVFGRCFQQAKKEDLEKILKNLKEELNIFEKSIQIVEQNGQRQTLIKKILLIFEQALRSERTKAEQYPKKFQDHSNYIEKNKRQLYFLNMVYEVQFMLKVYINKPVQRYDSNHIISFFEKKLFYITSIRRFSVFIQNVVFILRRLFVIKMKNPIPQETYNNMLLRLQQIIDKCFTRVKLIQNIEFFSFHMKDNYFFGFLTSIFNPSVKKQFQLIDVWKHQLSASLTESLPSQFREVSQSNIEDAIFYIQIRKKYDSLRSQNRVNQIEEFPLIDENVVLRSIRQKQIKTMKGIELSLKLIEILQKGEGKAFYNSSHILEKAIIFYYFHYYQGFSIRQKNFNIINNNVILIKKFKESLTHDQLLELIQFYLLQIELGNYYDVQLQDDYLCQNQINTLVYQSFIDVLYQRLLNAFTEYRKIETTKELFHLKIMHQYLILLIKAINPNQKVPFLCKGCKKTNEDVICDRCEYLCLGIKLHSSQHKCRDTFIYKEMVCRLQERFKEAYLHTSKEYQRSKVQWLYMFSSLSKSMISHK